MVAVGCKVKARKILDSIQETLNNSGPIQPERFKVPDSEVRPGLIYGISRDHRGLFPFSVGLLVVATDNETTTVCPVIIPPAVDREFLGSDLWLPAKQSPFRTLPGTGTMQVRRQWEAQVPKSGLGKPLQFIQIELLENKPPDKFMPREGLSEWHDTWEQLISSFWS